ncbi:hypothetical protein [Rhodopirellula europaea]|uniref:hypothetical protein n=1 Tax=Rhodopirellula europaea TaxID=1263866 RepID=UPI003D2C4B4A|tara:strand:- start:19048 stop:19383 length:336 start_codon:yes stop_codon:yes gene_type:complete
MTHQSMQTVSIEANLKLERFDHSRVIQVVEMSTTDNETIMIESSGSLPRFSLKHARASRSRLAAIAQATQQNLVVKHNGDVITQVSTTSNVSGKLSIHWWNLLKQYVLKRS